MNEHAKRCCSLNTTNNQFRWEANMNSDDWRQVEVPGDHMEFCKLERYLLIDTVTQARFSITWYDSPDQSSYSLAELENADEFEQEVRFALESGPTDGHFGGRKENLNDTLQKVWNNIQGARALLEKQTNK
jgi:hypothetical protein